jgi:hypothetical protein
VCAAGGAAPALAQDSISRNANGGSGLPGDALGVYTSGVNQRANFVLDLATIQTSWGTPLGVGPLIKSPKVNANRFTAVNGPSTISATVIPSATPLSTTFTRWTAAGGGLNATESDLALTQSVTIPAGVTSFGAAMLDFDEQVTGNTVVFTNVLSGAVASFDPANPARLYVTRVLGAVNGPSGSGDRSQFGLGAIDASGNLTFRADSFGASGVTLLSGDNYFRVCLPVRTTNANTIDNNGGTNATATESILRNSQTTLAVPSAIPSELAGRSVLLGADFVGQLLRESSVNTTTPTTAHRPGATDHRSSVAYSAQELFPSFPAGAGAMLTRSPAGGGKTDSISVFALDANGLPSSARTLTIPASITDPCDSFAWPIAGGDFRQYDSQQVFRGPSSPVAIGRTLAGLGLAGATLYNGSQPGSNSPFNAIVVARFDPASPSIPATWSTVAWVDTGAGDGKDILGDFGADGAPGTLDAGEGDGLIDATDAPIGRLASLSEGASGLVGPSLSAPAFDAAGNVYFTASVALKRRQGVIVIDEFKTALLRGVLDPATFCYRLELVLATGQTIPGQNSLRNYRVSYIGVADGDSVASAALWSGSVASQAWNAINSGSLPQSSPQHLGGLALSARIVYDADQDADFDDPTAPGASTASADEAYNALLYVANVTQPPPSCDSIDFNGDGIFPDNQDVIDFLEVFGGGPCPTGTCGDIDFNNDGVFPDNADIVTFIEVFGGASC